jgi:hypothetical protein
MTTETQLRLITENFQGIPKKVKSRQRDWEAAREQGVKIEPEELRFIYKLVIDGYSDAAILEEYINLHEAGKLDFPLRNSEEFIEDRRQEMEVAVQILKDGIKTMIQPLIAKQKEEHQIQLSEISAVLLQNNLNTVEESSSMGVYGLRQNGMFRYRYTIRDQNNRTVPLSRYQLFNMFRKNVETACQRYTQFVFYECYIPHLKHEIPEIDEEGFWPQVERQPYEVITAIKNLTKLDMLRGVCPLCNDFESKIPPFIRPILDNDMALPVGSVEEYQELSVSN